MDVIQQLRSRLEALITRAKVTLVSEAKKTQLVQLNIWGDDDTEDDVEHVQTFGFSSCLPEGQEDGQALAFALGGSRSATMAIGVHAPSLRPQDCDPGGAGMYNNAGWQVYCAPDGGGVHLGASGKEAPEKIPRDDHLQDELDRIKTELDAVKSDFQTLLTAISSAPTAPMDGGSTFKGALVGALSGWPAMNPASPGSTECDNVYGE